MSTKVPPRNNNILRLQLHLERYLSKGYLSRVFFFAVAPDVVAFREREGKEKTGVGCNGWVGLSVGMVSWELCEVVVDKRSRDFDLL